MKAKKEVTKKNDQSLGTRKPALFVTYFLGQVLDLAGKMLGNVCVLPCNSCSPFQLHAKANPGRQ